MWRNEEMRAFVDWLHQRYLPLAHAKRTAFDGLDLYSLYNSVRAVIGHMEAIDPDLANLARQRYGCLSPWEADPAPHAALSGAYRKCEQDVAHILV